ncbi:MAG: putative baseplate assembly protein [Actinomycetota bacterium]|nr:putative baseplate assembly protein [Actinomycetota bacterium]
METRYRCRYPKRLREVKSREDSALNAIDYLEVLDALSPSERLRQRFLIVHCVRPVTGIDADNVRVEGGVRRVVNVVRASVAADKTDRLRDLPKGVRAGILDNDSPEKVLIVETGRPGDFSTYKLKLVESAISDEPPRGFDPILSRIEFRFKVECPSDFDCQPVRTAAMREYDEPRIDYLARDFSSLRRLLLDRLSTIMPDWKERNAADMGMALVEALAYAGDYLSYYQDAVANEAYLGTARKRVSVRRHAKLIDYSMHEGCNARAWVQISSVAGDIYVEKGTQLMTRLPGFGTLVDPNLVEYDKAMKLKPEIFETMHDAVINSVNNEIMFYTWGDDDCCLPIGATRATLLDNTLNRLKLRRGDVLVFEEIRGPLSGEAADRDPSRRHAVRLTEVYPEAEPVKGEYGEFKLELKRDNGAPQQSIDPINGELIVEVEWAQEDALPFSFCLEEVIAKGEESKGKQPVSVARGNIVLAEHGRTLGAGKGGVADVPEKLPFVGRGKYRPSLKEAGITYSIPYDDDKARDLPASLVLEQDPRQAVARVTLYDQKKNEWSAEPDLLRSGAFDRSFVVEMGDDGKARLRFGDDVLGQAPNEGTRFEAIYRVGNGPSGNVGAESITHIVSGDDGITSVANLMPAMGGTDAESIEEVRLYAPRAFRAQKRAVTTDDYAAVAMLHPEVQKAVATLRWTGSWHAMFITVDRAGGRQIDEAFEAELAGFIDRFRLAGHDVEVEPPIYVPLDIIMTVCLHEGYFRDKVKRTLMETFSDVELPNGKRGFFHPDNLTFGQPVYLSQVIATAMRVPGVRWVDMGGEHNRFRRWGEAPRDELEEGSIAMDRLEIARLDNEPSAPENGRIDFIMEGGQ